MAHYQYKQTPCSWHVAVGKVYNGEIGSTLSIIISFMQTTKITTVNNELKMVGYNNFNCFWLIYYGVFISLVIWRSILWVNILSVVVYFHYFSL